MYCTFCSSISNLFSVFCFWTCLTLWGGEQTYWKMGHGNVCLHVTLSIDPQVRNSNVRSASAFTGMKPTCVLTYVSAIKGYVCRVHFVAVPSHATTLCGGTLPASTRPSTAPRHLNHKLRSTIITTSKWTEAKPHKEVLHRETKSIRIVTEIPQRILYININT